MEPGSIELKPIATARTVFGVVLLENVLEATTQRFKSEKQLVKQARSSLPRTGCDLHSSFDDKPDGQVWQRAKALESAFFLEIEFTLASVGTARRLMPHQRGAQ